ncbi:MAG: exodeoxyribonuclease VII large subunit [Deltaproteobacteria bacterium]|jgi:exodeoxyribonuclease VII large subunit|nr:exodeoxyribonuclease VII large subunit [Deltaproteobacteria bacterium]
MEKLPEILTPTTLTARIDSCFKERFGRVYVEGEISGRFRQASGHVYFYLNDKKSKVKAIIWGSNRTGAATIAEDGLSVLARGYLSAYHARSEYQLIVEAMEPRGEGALRLAFEKMKARLESEGLFSPERKRKIPFWPQRVALLTSAKGAAVEDFIKTAVKLCPQAGIYLYPVKVQGEGAALEMASAIADINRWGSFDLIVLTRGGGSLEDLWAYNEEILVRAVANSRTLTFAAVGHATDLSLTEMAADGSAITPTSAAETLFPDTARLLSEVGKLTEWMAKSMTQRLKDRSRDLEELRRRILGFRERLSQEGIHVRNLLEKLAVLMRNELLRAWGNLEKVMEKLGYLSPAKQLERQKTELDGLLSRLAAAAGKLLLPHAQELGHTIDRLQLVSPLGILTRGYALATTREGAVIRTAKWLYPGFPFILTLAKGKIRAKVEEILETGERGGKSK